MTVSDAVRAAVADVPVAFVVDERGKTWPPQTAHCDHIYDGWCAVCRIAEPEALDAVLAAVTAALCTEVADAAETAVVAPPHEPDGLLAVGFVSEYRVPVRWRGRDAHLVDDLTIVRHPTEATWACFAGMPGGVHRSLDDDHQWIRRDERTERSRWVFDSATEALETALATPDVLEVATDDVSVLGSSEEAPAG